MGSQRVSGRHDQINTTLTLYEGKGATEIDLLRQYTRKQLGKCIEKGRHSKEKKKNANMYCGLGIVVYATVNNTLWWGERRINVWHDKHSYVYNAQHPSGGRLRQPFVNPN